MYQALMARTSAKHDRRTAGSELGLIAAKCIRSVLHAVSRDMFMSKTSNFFGRKKKGTIVSKNLLNGKVRSSKRMDFLSLLHRSAQVGGARGARTAERWNGGLLLWISVDVMKKKASVWYNTHERQGRHWLTWRLLVYERTIVWQISYFLHFEKTLNTPQDRSRTPRNCKPMTTMPATSVIKLYSRVFDHDYCPFLVLKIIFM